MATIGAIEARFDVPVVFADDPRQAASQIERWAWFFARELVLAANDLLRGIETSNGLKAR